MESNKRRLNVGAIIGLVCVIVLLIAIPIFNNRQSSNTEDIKTLNNNIITVNDKVEDIKKDIEKINKRTDELIEVIEDIKNQNDNQVIIIDELKEAEDIAEDIIWNKNNVPLFVDNKTYNLGAVEIEKIKDITVKERRTVYKVLADVLVDYDGEIKHFDVTIEIWKEDLTLSDIKWEDYEG